jgi:hypothetical protein
VHRKPGAPPQRNRFGNFEDEEAVDAKRSYFRDIVTDSKLVFKDQLLYEIAQLKAILATTHPAGYRDRELATRRLMDLRQMMLRLLNGMGGE